MPSKSTFQSFVRLLILVAAILTSIAAVSIILEVRQFDQLRQAMLIRLPTSVVAANASPTIIPTSTPSLQPLLEGEFIATQLWTGGDDITIQSDVDSDGLAETIVLGHQHPNGIKFEIINGEESYSLASDIGGLTGDGELPDQHYCQLAIVDVTRNGRFDILLAVGGMDDSQLTIWEFDKRQWENSRRGSAVNPFTLIARLKGQTTFRIIPEGTIDIPYGSVGGYDEVVWNGTNFAPQP